MKHADAWEDLREEISNEIAVTNSALGNIERGGRVYFAVKSKLLTLIYINALLDNLEEVYE